MERKIKQLISIALILVMVLGTPVRVLAQIANNEQQTGDGMEGMQYEIDAGTVNTFDGLLAKSIGQDSEHKDRGSIADVKVEGDTASVTYNLECEEAYITVAVYEEDGSLLLASGTECVNNGNATIDIILTGEFPDYFLVKVFLTEEDGTPLTSVFVCERYTKEIQEFFNMTVEDFPAERTINFDENIENNYAVYQESVIQIYEQDQENKITDCEDGDYIIEYPESKLLDLTKGDILAITSVEGELFYIKVSSVQYEEQKIYVVGDTDICLEDVFEVVRLNSGIGEMEATLDMSTADEDVEYVGQDSSPYRLSRGGIEGEYPVEEGKNKEYELAVEDGIVKLRYSIAAKDKDSPLIAGSDVNLGVSIKPKIILDLIGEYKEFSFDYTSVVDINTYCKMKLEFKSKKIGFPKIRCCGGVVNIKIALVLNFEAEGGIDIELSDKSTFSLKYSSASTAPNIMCDLNNIELEYLGMKGECYLGVTPTIDIEIINKVFGNGYIGLEGGIEGYAEASSSGDDSNIGIRHSCLTCHSGYLKGRGSIIAGVEVFRKWKNIKATLELPVYPICEFYNSLTYNKFGTAREITCPYKEYLVTVRVKNGQGNSLAGVPIDGTGLAQRPVTNMYGKTEFWLGSGQYMLHAYFVEESSNMATGNANHYLIIDDQPVTVELTLFSTGETGGPDNTNTGTYTVMGEEDEEKWLEVKNNKTGDRFEARLLADGTILIAGSGVIPDYVVFAIEDDWNHANKVYFSEGITEIGYAVAYAGNIQSVHLPNTLRVIGSDFGSVQEIVIPQSVSRIKEDVFAYSPYLQNVTILGQGVYIEDHAFHSCVNLEHVIMPDTTQLGQSVFSSSGINTLEFIKSSEGGKIRGRSEGAFLFCDNLRSVTIPGNFDLGSTEFGWCSNLESVVIEDGVSSIPRSTFIGCGNLETVVMPDSVTVIDENAFSDCDNLKSINLSKNLEFIGYSAGIRGDSVIIPTSIKSISMGAFSDNINQLIYEGSAKEWSQIAFQGRKADSDDFIWGGIENQIGCGIDPDKLIFLGGGTLEELDIVVLNAEALEEEDPTEEEPETEEDPTEEEPEIEEEPVEEEPETEEAVTEEEPEIEEEPAEEEPETEEDPAEEEPETEEDPTEEEPETEEAVTEEEPEIEEDPAEEEPETEEEPAEEEPETEEEPAEEELKIWEEDVLINSDYVAHSEDDCRILQNQMRHMPVGGALYAHRTSYTDLVPGEMYVYAALKDDKIHWSEPGNLLYLDQKVADPNGILQFTYRFSEEITNFFDYLRGRQAGQPAAVKEVILSKSDLVLYMFSQPVQLRATVIPEEADDTRLTWLSENPEVVSVDNNGLVIPKGIGSTWIRVMTSDGRLADTGCFVTVEDRSREKLVEEFVERCYLEILKRTGEPEGVEGWKNSILSGEKTGASIVQLFVTSNEFREKNLSSEAIVEILYRAMLGRDADIAGKENWTTHLQNGASPEYIVAGFANSEEFRDICDSYGVASGTLTLTQNRDQNIEITGFVSRCYRLILNREGDEMGLNSWTGGLLGRSYGGGRIVQEFIRSDEFKSRNLDDETKVEILYRTMLNREADLEGKLSWLECLDYGMSLDFVIFGFISSAEFESICQQYNVSKGEISLDQNRDQNSLITQFVNRCYRNALERKWDLSGLNDWAGKLLRKELTPRQVANSFVLSQEVADKGLSNGQFITLLYKVYMDRNPDEAGLSSWNEQMSNGMSRALVADFFGDSDEFRQIEESYGFYHEGWHLINGNWRYYDEFGNLISNRWILDGENWYYLDREGNMSSDKIIKDGNGKWYYVGLDGVMASNRWIDVASKNHTYGYERDYYYAKSDGELARNELLNQKGKKYYIDNEGKCVGNIIVTIEGKQYYFKPLPDGSMLKNSYVTYQGVTYKADEAGRLSESL